MVLPNHVSLFTVSLISLECKIYESFLLCCFGSTWNEAGPAQ